MELHDPSKQLTSVVNLIDLRHLTGAHYTITMNEGINAYYEHVAGSGGKVYGHPPKYEYANYPPVFFHLIGWLGSVTGDINVMGRWVSLLAYLAIAVFASL